MERYRFHPDGVLFYVTFTVIDWLPVFVSEVACKIVTDSLNFSHRQRGLRTNAYVIMPTHIHGIFFHETFQAKALEQVLTDVRKFTGRQLADHAGKHLPHCFSEMLEQRAGHDRERRFWQATRHPVQIETEPFWQAKLDYLHANPCRKGLVSQPEHWRFSSASYWLGGGPCANDVVLSAVWW
jgi:REP element-mobilizing transposase RayT